MSITHSGPVVPGRQLSIGMRTCDGPACEEPTNGRFCSSSCRARAWRADRHLERAADVVELIGEDLRWGGEEGVALALAAAVPPAALERLLELLADRRA